MHEDAVRFLSQPVEAQPGSPLRVAVYSRIAEAIRNNLLTPGSMLPTETDLGTDMKVSRTVVREALMLLEEDGLIRARRGVARFVSDTLPASASNASAPSRRSSAAPGTRSRSSASRSRSSRPPNSSPPAWASNPAPRSGSGSPS